MKPTTYSLSSRTRDLTAKLPCDERSTSLALDLGSTSGWALRDATGVSASGVRQCGPNRFDGETSGPLSAVFCEEVRAHAGTLAAHVYGGFLAHLEAWAEFRDVPYQGVPVGTIKRFIAGKGNADKQAVIAAVKARGFVPADDNEADAIAILLWAVKPYGGAS